MTLNKIQKNLLNRHQQLNQSNNMKVVSHVQREDGEWFVNTLMLENISTPFKYKRKQPYQSLTGCRVNLSYYRDVEAVAGLEFEYMKVVRLRKS
ncbi:hypothetical protein [Thalassotalea maritima]|uniref:hypothetical protein n=1 Tax=Thalassotalea maritima TaxID=3242416 RepID=UPI0035283AB9